MRTQVSSLHENTSVIGLLFSSVQFSRSVVSDSLWPHELQHAMPPCPDAKIMFLHFWNLSFDVGIQFKWMWLCYILFWCEFLTLCFFANNLLPAVYFIFILDYGNAVRQKQIWAAFLLGSLPDSSIHGIFQARVLEWGARAFSNFPHERNTKKYNSEVE